MNEDNFIISDEQCYQFASNLYLDIANYISKNEEDYKKWLKEMKEK